MKRKNAFKLLMLSVLSALLMACGNAGSARIRSAGIFKAQVSGGNDASLSSFYSDAKDERNYSCPKQANVTPDYDWELDGSGFYRVCSSRTNATDVKVNGMASTDEICVFPAQYYNSTTIYTKPDLQSGLPIYTCHAFTDLSGTAVTFLGINYNALYIVEAKDKLQMQFCLSSGGDYYKCPHYSFGRFR